MTKKILTAIVCAAVSVVIFAGCGKSSQNVDLNAVADELLDEAGFEDELIKAQPASVENIYFIESDMASEMVVYMSSNNSTPEEIALFKATDADSLAKLETVVNGRLEEQKMSFENYAPDEVYKIENAVVKKSGDYIFMVICPDSETANKIVSNAI